MEGIRFLDTNNHAFPLKFVMKDEYVMPEYSTTDGHECEMRNTWRETSRPSIWYDFISNYNPTLFKTCMASEIALSPEGNCLTSTER